MTTTQAQEILLHNTQNSSQRRPGEKGNRTIAIFITEEASDSEIDTDSTAEHAESPNITLFA